MRIDLHTHSVASDGTERPAEVVQAAAVAGLDVVALTDHDTVDGWAEAVEAGQRLGVAVVRGIELSCRSAGRSVHLLAYLPDPHDQALAAELARIRTARDTRARRIVDRLAADHPLTWDDVVAQTATGATVGRPHIADALVAAGVVGERGEAFAELLAVGSPYYVPHYAPEALRAVRLVRAAGGVPVVAHPGAAGRDTPLSDAELAALVDAGLAGVEVHHRDHDAAQVERLTVLARRHGVLATGSSDYHGAGKPNRIGENVTSPQVLAAIEEQGRLAVVR